jgi:hypothetical protein
MTLPGSSGAGPFGVETPPLGPLPACQTPIVTPLPTPAATFITAYFRTTINVPAVGAGQSLVLTHFIDDGAAIYVDGVLALRYNLTNDPPILSTAMTPAAVPGDGDAVLVSVPVTIPAGQHVIAVEVHQNSATSSDVVFGAELPSHQRNRSEPHDYPSDGNERDSHVASESVV